MNAGAPDFDQIAHSIVDRYRHPNDPYSFLETERLTTIAEQLRQVWNARGAADCARIAAASDEDVLDLAIKNLDR